MARIFMCRNMHQPPAELRLVKEADDNAVLQCPVCNSVQVFTRTKERDKILFEKQRREHQERVERMRREEQKVKIFV